MARNQYTFKCPLQTCRQTMTLTLLYPPKYAPWCAGKDNTHNKKMVLVENE